MQRLIILHSADIHGEADGLARIATLVQEIRAENAHTPVLYFDVGDSQDRSNALSEKTLGVAMHRLLRVAGCQATTLGNKCMKRYGMEVVRAYAAQLPILVANLLMPDGTSIPGTQPSAIFDLGSFKIGVVGVTADTPGYIKHHRLRTLDILPVVQGHFAILREAGAHYTVILSHLGLADDYMLARAFQHKAVLILGGHTHALLPNGAGVGQVQVVHVGDYARYLGRVDLIWDGQELRVERTAVIKVLDTIAKAPAILDEIERIMAATLADP